MCRHEAGARAAGLSAARISGALRDVPRARRAPSARNQTSMIGPNSAPTTPVPVLLEHEQRDQHPTEIGTT